MSEGQVPGSTTRDPASKMSVAVELGSVGALIGAAGPMLAEQGVGPATAAFASAAFAVLIGVGVSFVRDWKFNRKKGV